MEAVLQWACPVDAQPPGHVEVPRGCVRHRDLVLDLEVTPCGRRAGHSRAHNERPLQRAVLVDVRPLIRNIDHDVLARARGCGLRSSLRQRARRWYGEYIPGMQQ